MLNNTFPFSVLIKELYYGIQVLKKQLNHSDYLLRLFIRKTINYLNLLKERKRI